MKGRWWLVEIGLKLGWRLVEHLRRLVVTSWAARRESGGKSRRRGTEVGLVESAKRWWVVESSGGSLGGGVEPAVPVVRIVRRRSSLDAHHIPRQPISSTSSLLPALDVGGNGCSICSHFSPTFSSTSSKRRGGGCRSNSAFSSRRSPGSLPTLVA